MSNAQPAQPASSQQQPRQYLTPECRFHSEYVKDIKEPTSVRRTRWAISITWLIWPLIVGFIGDPDRSLALFLRSDVWGLYILFEIFTMPFILGMLENWLKDIESRNNVHIIKHFHTSYWASPPAHPIRVSDWLDARDVGKHYFEYQQMYYLQQINRTLQADAMRRENEMAQLRSEIARLDSVNRAREYRRQFER